MHDARVDDEQRGHDCERAQRCVHHDQPDEQRAECGYERDKKALRTAALCKERALVAARDAYVPSPGASGRGRGQAAIRVVDLEADRRFPGPVASGQRSDAARGATDLLAPHERQSYEADGRGTRFATNSAPSGETLSG